jgi:hypothetical protein
MRTRILATGVVLLFSNLVLAQNKRLWVLRPNGEAVEYDAAALSAKQTLKIPAEAASSPSAFSVNSEGQMLFAAPAALPLVEGDLSAQRTVWFWNGRQATTLTRDVNRTNSTAGSNLVITESAPVPSLSSDGKYLFWFSNRGRRLQRDGVDLSTKNTWLGWRTDLEGKNRQDVASIDLPDCACPTGGCEETCAYEQVWVPESGVSTFFLLTQFVAGQTKPVYKSSSIVEETAGKWNAEPVSLPLRNVLDAANPDAILEAIPDTGCCGWSNESDDQTLLRVHGKTLNVFDELTAYKNPDYDVSFYTQNGKLSPDMKFVALTIISTGKPNTAIQLAEQGQANPAESQLIRKALAELPAVEIESVEDVPRRVALLPHAELVGWINNAEVLIVEEHVLAFYNPSLGTTRKSTIHVEDSAHVFLR